MLKGMQNIEIFLVHSNVEMTCGIRKSNIFIFSPFKDEGRRYNLRMISKIDIRYSESKG
jgi:hypothetical protein